MNEIARTLSELATGLTEHRDRVMVEGPDGKQFELSRVFVVGARTDDPGLVIRVWLT